VSGQVDVFSILADVLNPDIPSEDRFIPPVEYLTASNAASARADGLTLPWKQHVGNA
jgi:hypothetical protein